MMNVEQCKRDAEKIDSLSGYSYNEKEELDELMDDMLEDKTPHLKMRALKAKDLFIMTSILSKINFKNIQECITPDIIKSFQKKNSNAGVQLGISVASILLSSINLVEKDLYKFLAQLTDLTTEDIENISIAEFIQLIVDVIKKEEFSDFFKVVSKSLK